MFSIAETQTLVLARKMAKAKNKKKQISDKVRGKKKEAVRKINPFEVKINKQKHHVLGKKTTKFDKGMPGVSRSKAIKKVMHHHLCDSCEPQWNL